MTFAKFYANWVVPEKFKWGPLIPMFWLIIFVLPAISVFNWRRWFVSWLTVNPAFSSSDLTLGVEIVTLQCGTCSLTIFFFKFSNWIKISLDMNLLASVVPAWVVKWLGFFLNIGIRLCHISSTLAPGKFRTFTTWFFLCNLSWKTLFIIDSPAATIVYLGYKSLRLLVLWSFEEHFLEPCNSSFFFFFFTLFNCSCNDHFSSLFWGACSPSKLALLSYLIRKI